jgi:translation initiation factor 1A
MGIENGVGGRRRKQLRKSENELKKLEAPWAEEQQVYAKVLKLLGNNRIETTDVSGHSRLAIIRGNLRKKVWIATGDIVLLSLREWDASAKADVIYRYSMEQIRILRKHGEPVVFLDAGDVCGDIDDLVEFDDDVDAI